MDMVVYTRQPIQHSIYNLYLPVLSTCLLRAFPLSFEFLAVMLAWGMQQLDQVVSHQL